MFEPIVIFRRQLWGYILWLSVGLINVYNFLHNSLNWDLYSLFNFYSFYHLFNNFYNFFYWNFYKFFYNFLLNNNFVLIHNFFLKNNISPIDINSFLFPVKVGFPILFFIKYVLFFSLTIFLTSGFLSKLLLKIIDLLVLLC